MCCFFISLSFLYDHAHVKKIQKETTLPSTLRDQFLDSKHLLLFSFHNYKRHKGVFFNSLRNLSQKGYPRLLTNNSWTVND